VIMSRISGEAPRTPKRYREDHQIGKVGKQQSTQTQPCLWARPQGKVAMRVTPHAKYPGKAPTLESTRAPLLLEKYSGRNQASGIWAAGVWTTTVTDPGNQAERTGTNPCWKSTRWFTYAGMVLGSGEHAKLACNHWLKYIGS